MTEPVATMDTVDRVRSAVEAALDRKAIDLRVLHLRKVCDFTDYFVICTGANGRQVGAIADAVGDRLISLQIKPLHLEGRRFGRWILMDYGDFLVHVFDPQRRDHYRLEDMWSDAPDETEHFVVAELRPEG